MESGSAVVGREERKKKYHIYVEEYVLSYLRRESDSLELSEIYFYGSRQENGRKLYVYGAGRDRRIAAFAEYEPLPELVCRLTQAGPVFLVRESDGECRASGFQVFYDNNEAMQNYLLEWTSSAGKKRNVEKSSVPDTMPVPLVFPEEEKKRTPHGAMSVQLCLILVVLVAIVITSTDSYDKMEELNRSAKEVFFAIENQEAGERVLETDSREDADAQAQDKGSDGVRGDSAKDIVFEKENIAAEKEAAAERETESSEEAEQEEEESAEEPVQTSDSEEPADDRTQDEEPERAEPEEEDADTDGTGDADKEEEALSRSITRYYEVEQGDTLYTISQKIYGDTSRVEKICEVNQISDPDKIRSGQRIILP